MEALWLWLDRTSIILSLVLAVPVLWTWYHVVFGEPRQRRRWLAEIARRPGNRPGVLILDLLPGKSIRASVAAHMASDTRLQGLPEERVIHIARNAPLQPGHIVDLARELREAARKLLDAGCDVVHLFHAGPDVSALIAGAELSNGPRELLYHFEQGGYQAFGPLEPLRNMD